MDHIKLLADNPEKWVDPKEQEHQIQKDFIMDLFLFDVS